MHSQIDFASLNFLNKYFFLYQAPIDFILASYPNYLFFSHMFSILRIIIMFLVHSLFVPFYFYIKYLLY
jgi:hypothetical protein